MLDPVCGMTVAEGSLTTSRYPEFGFCSEHCRQAFLSDPAWYLGATKADASGHRGADYPAPAEPGAERHPG